jgi:hypothetical protein
VNHRTSHVVLIKAAEQDLVRILAEDRKLGVRVRAVLELLADGSVAGVPLREMASYGDLRDCMKVYIGRSPQSASHRIVYRVRAGSAPREASTLEVIAVEVREEGYAYLLAADRLGRLPVETRSKFGRVHQKMIARRGMRRKFDRSDP